MEKIWLPIKSTFITLLISTSFTGVSFAQPGGGTQYVLEPNQPTAEVEILNQHEALAPNSAPAEVVGAVKAANAIARKPYRWGGGHRRFKSSGYDCSGAVSYVLHKAGLLSEPLASSGLMRWGRRGHGNWITVYANHGHTFIVIAGSRFDTSGAGNSGPRWRVERRSLRGYEPRSYKKL